jgi:hypothetical protein
MLKRLAILAVMGLAALAPICPQETSDQKKSKSKDSPPPSVSIVDNSTRQIKADGPAQESPESHTAFEYSNWALVVIGAFGVLAAFITLREIGRQTKAAKDAASFALLNAQAIINAERAWIVVGIVSRKPGVYTILAENVGQTPARLVTNFSDVSILPHGQSLAPVPEYKTQRLDGMVPTLYLPKDKRQLFEITTDAISKSKFPNREPSAEAIEFLEIHFFGKIVYEDTLNTGKAPESNPIHETKWCFKYFPIKDGVAMSHPYVCPSGYVDYS